MSDKDGEKARDGGAMKDKNKRQRYDEGQTEGAEAV